MSRARGVPLHPALRGASGAGSAGPFRRRCPLTFVFHSSTLLDVIPPVPNGLRMPEPSAASSRVRSAAAAQAVVPAAPPPVALLFLRGRDADGRIQRLVTARRALRPALGALALPLVKRRLYETLGFRCLGDYARERLGVPAQAVREWARVGEALAGLPQLRAAVLSGEVSWSVARQAVAHASPETDEAFVHSLRGRTVHAAEEMLRAAFGPEQPGEERDTGEEEEDGERAERVRVCVPLPAADHGRWLAALELARRMAGEALPVWECAEDIAAEALGSIPPECIAQAGAANEISRAAAGRAPAPQCAATERPACEHGLRQEAFGLLRWDHGFSVSNRGFAILNQGVAIPNLDPGRLAAWAESVSAHAIDRALRRAMKGLQRIDHDLGHLLRQLLDRKLYRELGFRSFERYVQERVDVSPRTARRWVCLARLGPAGSAVASALRSAEISPKQADVIAAAVPPEQRAEAVAFARGVTLRGLEAALGARGTARVAITFTAPQEAANVFLLALAAARLHLGAAQRQRSRQAGTEALLWILEHAIETWTEHGAQFDDYADFTRDGFRCTAPGCTARRSLQSHHVIFRSAGGPDEPSNRTTLCAFHHLRGVHAGTIACRGRAPEGLVFELGLRAAGPPLLRTRRGDVLVGAAS